MYYLALFVHSSFVHVLYCTLMLNYISEKLNTDFKMLHKIARTLCIQCLFIDVVDISGTYTA